MPRLDTIVEGINIIENTDMGVNNSALAIPLSFIAHNELLVRIAELLPRVTLVTVGYSMQRI